MSPPKKKKKKKKRKTQGRAPAIHRITASQAFASISQTKYRCPTTAQQNKFRYISLSTILQGARIKIEHMLLYRLTYTGYSLK